MTEITGDWSGKITGTNNADVFLELDQDGNNIKGTARINDPVHGVAVYTLSGTLTGNKIILSMLPPPPQTKHTDVLINNQKMRLDYQASNHGNVTVEAHLVDEITIEGKWSSSIGTGGDVFLKNALKKQKNRPSSESLKKKPQVFISYSHIDEKYLKRLQVHLKPLENNGIIERWDDTKIKTGDKWKEEITKALDASAIAVLIISADFLASDFIIDNELPPLLEKAQMDGTKILPVILSHCRFIRDKHLSQFQSLNPPDMPILQMSENEQEKIWNKLSNVIEDQIDAIN